MMKRILLASAMVISAPAFAQDAVPALRRVLATKYRVSMNVMHETVTGLAHYSLQA